MAKREEIFELPGVEKKEAEDAFASKEKDKKKSWLMDNSSLI